MSRFPSFPACLFACIFGAGTADAVTLSGKVVNRNGTPRPGIVVALSGYGISTTTAADGSWSLSSATRLSPRLGKPRPEPEAGLVVREGRLRVEISGRAASGQFLSSRSPDAKAPAGALRSAAALPDTLSYGWGGKVFLRDTVGTLDQSGIVRRFDTTLNPAIVRGYFTDARDGMVYRTVRIGKQTWMAENLAFRSEGPDSGWCYFDDTLQCLTLGRLYTWAGALAIEHRFDTLLWLGDTIPRKGICPQGWHVPAKAEWKYLVDTALGSDSAGYCLRSRAGWTGYQPTPDPYGFAGMPGGGRNDAGVFTAGGGWGMFWTTGEMNRGNADIRMLWGWYAPLYLESYAKTNAFSVRCLAD